MDMNIEDLAGGITKVTLRGRLDLAAANQAELRFSTVTGAKRAVIVDLAGLTFLASMGIRMLLIGAKTVKSKGGKMALLAPGSEVAAVLKTARIDALIPIYDNDATAIAGVGA